METLVCSVCETPLAKKPNYLAFRCMCDDEIRTISSDVDLKYCDYVKYLYIIERNSEYEQHSKQSNCIKTE